MSKKVLKNLLDEYVKPASDGVRYFSSPAKEEGFEQHYLNVRKLEGRLFSDGQVIMLPFAFPGTPQQKEWLMRAKSLERFVAYLDEQKAEGPVLDIGCGNGWFSAKVSHLAEIEVLGLDINKEELQQAARVFPEEPSFWAYADIFKTQLPKKSFQYITLNSSVQYFSNLDQLFSRLKELLVDGGEVHILDSPFYKLKNREEAVVRSKAYYEKAGVPEMAFRYHHHTVEAMEGKGAKRLYQAGGFKNKILKLFGAPDSPFDWWCLKY